MTKRVFRCARETQRTAELRCDRMLMDDEYCDMQLTKVALKSGWHSYKGLVVTQT